MPTRTHYCAHCDAYRPVACSPSAHWHTPDASGNCATCGTPDN